MTELEMFEMERIGVMIFESPEDLVAHPFDLRFGKLDDVVRDVVKQRQGEFGQSGLLTPP